MRLVRLMLRSIIQDVLQDMLECKVSMRLLLYYNAIIYTEKLVIKRFLSLCCNWPQRKLVYSFR